MHILFIGCQISVRGYPNGAVRRDSSYVTALLSLIRHESHEAVHYAIHLLFDPSTKLAVGPEQTSNFLFPEQLLSCSLVCGLFTRGRWATIRTAPLRAAPHSTVYDPSQQRTAQHSPHHTPPPIIHAAPPITASQRTESLSTAQHYTSPHCTARTAQHCKAQQGTDSTAQQRSPGRCGEVGRGEGRQGRGEGRGRSGSSGRCGGVGRGRSSPGRGGGVGSLRARGEGGQGWKDGEEGKVYFHRQSQLDEAAKEYAEARFSSAALPSHGATTPLQVTKPAPRGKMSAPRPAPRSAPAQITTPGSFGGRARRGPAALASRAQPSPAGSTLRLKSLKI
jgi:hypothetical protein